MYAQSYGSPMETSYAGSVAPKADPMYYDRKQGYEILLKFIVIGDDCVGKTCLLLQFTDKRYRKMHMTTIGVEFGSRIVNIDNRRVKLQVWDTAGQERFRSLTRGYYRGSAAALLVYDITQRDTFDHVNKWLDDIWSEAGRDIALTLVGNKSDLVDQRVVSYDEGHNLAKNYGLNFIETSAVTGSFVDDAFVETANFVLRTKVPETQELDRNNANNPWMQTDNGIRIESSGNRYEQHEEDEGCC